MQEQVARWCHILAKKFDNRRRARLLLEDSAQLTAARLPHASSRKQLGDSGWHSVRQLLQWHSHRKMPASSLSRWPVSP